MTSSLNYSTPFGSVQHTPFGSVQHTPFGYVQHTPIESIKNSENKELTINKLSTINKKPNN